MANPTWPGTLPASPLLDGFGEEYSDFNATFEPDAGLPSSWPRSSVGRISSPWRLILTGAQRTALKTFWKTTTTFGSLVFDMTDPIEGGTITVKFDGPIRFTATGGSTKPWLAEFNLIRLG